MWEAEFGKLSTTAIRQNGVFTTAQATRLGISAELIAHFARTGLVEQTERDIFYLIASDPVGPAYSLRYAEWLALYPESFAWERVDDRRGAVMSHESACQLHKMGTFDGAPIVFTMPAERGVPRATRIHVARLAPEDVMLVKGIPVTTPLRTIVDLMRDDVEPEPLARVISDAVHNDLVDLRAVHRELLPLADEHDFPVDGQEFVEYFVPDLDVASLSPRNVRAFAALMFPERVAEILPEVRRLAMSVRGQNAAGNDEFCSELAEELVGRSVWPPN